MPSTIGRVFARRIRGSLVSAALAAVAVQTPAAELTWQAGSGNWDHSTKAWLIAGQPGTYAFTDGDRAVFGAITEGTSRTITLTEPVAPLDVWFENDTGVYTLAGQPVTGSASITKIGAGQVILKNTNTYTGNTFIVAGELILDGTGVAGSGDSEIELGVAGYDFEVDLTITPGHTLDRNIRIADTGYWNGILCYGGVAPGQAVLSGRLTTEGYAWLATEPGSSLRITGTIDNTAGYVLAAAGEVTLEGPVLDGAYSEFWSIYQQSLLTLRTQVGSQSSLVSIMDAAIDVRQGQAVRSLDFVDGGTIRLSAASLVAAGLTAYGGGSLDHGAGTVTVNASEALEWMSTLELYGQAGGALMLNNISATPSGQTPAAIHVHDQATLILGAGNTTDFSTGRLRISTDTGGRFSVTLGRHEVAGVDGSGATLIASGATLVANSVRQGQLTLAGTGQLILRPLAHAAPSMVGELIMDPGALIDLGGSSLITSFSGDRLAAYDILRKLVLAGQSGIAGIISSSPFAGPVELSTVAIMDNTLFHLLVWQGLTISDGIDFDQFILTRALIGDVDLDGQVTPADYYAIIANMGRSGATWAEGDIDFDGRVTPADAALVAAHLPVAAAYARPAAFATVPEPASLLLCVAGSLLLGRRRGKR